MNDQLVAGLDPFLRLREQNPCSAPVDAEYPKPESITQSTLRQCLTNQDRVIRHGHFKNLFLQLLHPGQIIGRSRLEQLLWRNSAHCSTGLPGLPGLFF